MAKKITGYIKLQIPAGKANPAPPIGPGAAPDVERKAHAARRGMKVCTSEDQLETLIAQAGSEAKATPIRIRSRTTF